VSDGPLLDRERIEQAFWLLGDKLAARGVVADIYVFGGAAMVLAYDAQRATRDIDAIFNLTAWSWMKHATSPMRSDSRPGG
jgi:hypothetical protein